MRVSSLAVGSSCEFGASDDTCCTERTIGFSATSIAVKAARQERNHCKRHRWTSSSFSSLSSSPTPSFVVLFFFLFHAVLLEKPSTFTSSFPFTGSCSSSNNNRFFVVSAFVLTTNKQPPATALSLGKSLQNGRDHGHGRSPENFLPAGFSANTKFPQRHGVRTSFVLSAAAESDINNDNNGRVSETTQAESSTQTTGTMQDHRRIRVERMPRLPVWPVWAGVIDFFVGWIFGAEAGSKLEQHFLGGRVCPMQLDGVSTSPFLLLVHHHHNFWKWDAIFRKLSSLVLPEGFPAHPHRGFTTLTYFLPRNDDEQENRNGGGGGFVHRDSIGVKQTYGTKGSYEHQAQWLFTGRGMLHEEMFDFARSGDKNKNNNNRRYDSRYELYQLWVNVPGAHKLDPPVVQLLQTSDINRDGNDGSTTPTTNKQSNNQPNAMPTVVTTQTSTVSSARGERRTTRCNVIVIAGSYQPHDDSNDREVFRSQAAPLHSDLSVLHVAINERTTPATTIATTNDSGNEKSSRPGWTYDIPSGHETLIVYVRKGSCTMETTFGASRSLPTEVPIHSTVFVERDRAASSSNPALRERLIVKPTQQDDPVDLLVLSGRPLYENDDGEGSSTRLVVEPVAMQGSMVMNNEAQIQAAYRDYQYGQMGVPWEHTLGDDEWLEHVRQTAPLMGSTPRPPRTTTWQED